jgi:predicted transcriptional regulator of viral defense system
MKRQTTNDFFATHPVFSLDEATSMLSPPGGKSGTIERLKYHLQTGRLKLVTREIYAVVPSGISIERFHPDPFLIAAAIRPVGVFCFHSALELLGAAHSVWNRSTLYANKPRRPVVSGSTTIQFIKHPPAMGPKRGRPFGTRSIERRGRLLLCTGPERTLVEGFRRPALAGGLEEHIVSASGFPTLDLALLQTILHRYAVRTLWSAVGWFLESFQKTFHVSDDYLRILERHRPASPHYLERNRRGGVLLPRWNLIAAKQLTRLSEPDES